MGWHGEATEAEIKEHYETSKYETYTAPKQVFTSSLMNDLYDPAKMKLPREACDSPKSPRSRALIFAEDVTGSMGEFLLSMVQKDFPRLIRAAYEIKSYNPHIMFMGIGDVSEGDRAPLQVTQFEPDLRMLEQLKQIYLEGGGGSNPYESYILAWYFAANFTRIDCFEKRGEKGFLFTFGDENPTPQLSKYELSSVFGGRDNFQGNMVTAIDCLNMAEKMYYCYHIVLHGSAYSKLHPQNQWRKLMGGHVCDLNDHECLPELVTTILAMYEGKSKSEAIAKIPEMYARDVVRDALIWHEENVTISKPEVVKADIEVF